MQPGAPTARTPTAAALVIGPIFFPHGEPGVQTLQAFATFAIAFLARPIGAAAFGHFGDRIGRKATLVASLMIMGLSTVLIGCLPGYASIGWWAPALLCLLRFGQGVGFGGEWGGAALLAVENEDGRCQEGQTPAPGFEIRQAQSHAEPKEQEVGGDEADWRAELREDAVESA
jgi:MFS family permease